MRRIAVATFGRADYGTCLPIMRAIRADDRLELQVYAGGAHLSDSFGRTETAIESDGFIIDERIEMPLDGDSGQAFAAAVGHATTGLAAALARRRPDILLVVGDRLELMAAATAALACGVPLAHVSGGDVTEGALDNQVRYGVSKMSHVHFVALQAHAERLLQMGEEAWRVHVTGEPALDTLRAIRLLSRSELSERLGIALDPPIVVATCHPTTLSEIDAGAEVDACLAALAHVQGTIILTYPNMDPGHTAIVDRLRRFANGRPRVRVFESLGQAAYYSVLAVADVMVGNSSSAIWEAPSFALPAVDVGERQKGRFSAANVVHARSDAAAIARAIADVLRPDFRASLRGMKNPYGDGCAGPRIARVLEDLDPGLRLLRKRFEERPA